LSSVLSATFNFENLYKVGASGFDALRQEMIGHQAVGVHVERIVGGFHAQKAQKPMGEFCIREDRPALERTYRYEIEVLAEIVERLNSNRFVIWEFRSGLLIEDNLDWRTASEGGRYKGNPRVVNFDCVCGVCGGGFCW
jgi:hypothetical protein